METVRQLLTEQTAAFEQMGFQGCLIQKAVLEAGDCEATEAVSLPELGTPKECFTNAGKFVQSHTGFDYVEGFVLAEGLPIPIHHAWLWSQETEQVVETTMDIRGRDVSYLGIIFTPDKYAKALSDWGYWGLFDAVHPNFELLAELSQDVRGIVSQMKAAQRASQ